MQDIRPVTQAVSSPIPIKKSLKSSTSLAVNKLLNNWQAPSLTPSPTSCPSSPIFSPPSSKCWRIKFSEAFKAQIAPDQTLSLYRGALGLSISMEKSATQELLHNALEEFTTLNPKYVSMRTIEYPINNKSIVVIMLTPRHQDGKLCIQDLQNELEHMRITEDEEIFSDEETHAQDYTSLLKMR